MGFRFIFMLKTELKRKNIFLNKIVKFQRNTNFSLEIYVVSCYNKNKCIHDMEERYANSEFISKTD